MTASRTPESKHHRELAKCAISGRQLPRRELIGLDSVRPLLADRMRNDHPGLGPDDLVALDEVARYRARYVEELLTQEMGELSDLERKVAESLATNAMLAENIEDTYAGKRTFGEAVSDQLASFGGSWTFILAFGAVLGAWIVLNLSQGTGAFDPYPFILLNLVLSCLAAIQAPVIMMSQKRQEEKDRLRSRNDYQVNLKAELEIRNLHEKIDHLLSRQWQRLMDIQQLQLDILQERRR
ncbi:MAG: DUF1003 domain-containing protein [Hyphomicrobiaceae bacterium]